MCLHRSKVKQSFLQLHQLAVCSAAYLRTGRAVPRWGLCLPLYLTLKASSPRAKTTGTKLRQASAYSAHAQLSVPSISTLHRKLWCWLRRLRCLPSLFRQRSPCSLSPFWRWESLGMCGGSENRRRWSLGQGNEAFVASSFDVLFTANRSTRV